MTMPNLEPGAAGQGAAVPGPRDRGAADGPGADRLRPARRGGPTRPTPLHGLLIATPRQPVLAAVEAVEKAGLKVARVDLSTFAALRSIAHEQLSVEAVIDMGAHLTNIVIHNQGIPKVVRTVPRGGRELTDHLRGRIGMAWSEAEAAKCEVGLNGQTGRHHQLPQRGHPAAAGRDPQLDPLLRLDQQRRADRTDLAHRRCVRPARPGQGPVRPARHPDQRRHPDAAHPQPLGVQAGPDRRRPRASPAPSRSAWRWEQQHDRGTCSRPASCGAPCPAGESSPT